MKRLLVVGASVAALWAGEVRAALQDCTLTWTENAEADLQGYHIYAQTKGAGQAIKGQFQADIPKGRSSAKCSDMRLTTPGTYFFSMTAYDQRLNESDFSNEVSKALLEIPAVGAPGLITDFKVTPDIGGVTVLLTPPDDGTGNKVASIDVRYEEGNTIGWGGATQFACLSFPCKIVGLKHGLPYTVQAIPVRRVAGSPSVFGVFTGPQTVTTLTDIIPPIDPPPIDPPPVKPTILDVTMEEKDGKILVSVKMSINKGDLKP